MSVTFLIPDGESIDGYTTHLAVRDIENAKAIVSHRPASEQFVFATTNPIIFANVLKGTNIFCALATEGAVVTEFHEFELGIQALHWRQVRDVLRFDDVPLFMDGDVQTPIVASVIAAGEILADENVRSQLSVYIRALTEYLPAMHTLNDPCVIPVTGPMPERSVVESATEYMKLVDSDMAVFVLDKATADPFPIETRNRSEWELAWAFYELTCAIEDVREFKTPRGKRKAPPLIAANQPDSEELTWSAFLVHVLEYANSEVVPIAVRHQILCACDALGQLLHFPERDIAKWSTALHTTTRACLIRTTDAPVSLAGSVIDADADIDDDGSVALGSDDDEEDIFTSGEEWDPHGDDDDNESIGLGFGGEDAGDDESDYSGDDEESAEETGDDEEAPAPVRVKAPRKQKNPRRIQLSDDDDDAANDRLGGSECEPDSPMPNGAEPKSPPEGYEPSSEDDDESDGELRRFESTVMPDVGCGPLEHPEDAWPWKTCSPDLSFREEVEF
jgi:hypothetical protein